MRGNITTPAILKEMFSLRQQGWSLSRLAKKFGYKDHTSVLYHLQRHNIKISSNLYSAPKIEKKINDYQFHSFAREKVRTVDKYSARSLYCNLCGIKTKELKKTTCLNNNALIKVVVCDQCWLKLSAEKNETF